MSNFPPKTNRYIKEQKMTHTLGRKKAININ